MQEILDEAIKFMEKDANHDLPLGYRRAIWSELGPYINHSKPQESKGHRRRVMLAISTVRHVLPVWEKFWIEDYTPHDLLAVTEGILAGHITRKVAEEELWNTEPYLEELQTSDESRWAVMVGYSALGALSLAIQDINFSKEGINYSIRDADVDPYEKDNAYDAVVAYADGPIWEIKSESIKRKAFWEWWLKDAVPEISTAD